MSSARPWTGPGAPRPRRRIRDPRRPAAPRARRRPLRSDTAPLERHEVAEAALTRPARRSPGSRPTWARRSPARSRRPAPAPAGARGPAGRVGPPRPAPRGSCPRSARASSPRAKRAWARSRSSDLSAHLPLGLAERGVEVHVLGSRARRPPSRPRSSRRRGAPPLPIKLASPCRSPSSAPAPAAPPPPARSSAGSPGAGRAPPPRARRPGAGRRPRPIRPRCPPASPPGRKPDALHDDAGRVQLRHPLDLHLAVRGPGSAPPPGPGPSAAGRPGRDSRPRPPRKRQQRAGREGREVRCRPIQPRSLLMPVRRPAPPPSSVGPPVRLPVSRTSAARARARPGS